MALVQFIGTPISGGDYPGYSKDQAYDNNFGTDWADDDVGGYIGANLGVSATVEYVEITPSLGAAEEIRLRNATIQSSSAADFSGATTHATLPATVPATMPPRIRNRVNITPAAAQYWKLELAPGVAGSLTELRWIGQPAVGATCRPVRPTMSPWGGIYPAGEVEVTLSAEAGDSIYYTTDGSAPDNTKTLYTAPITLSVGSATELRFIAYNASRDTVYSEEPNRGRFTDALRPNVAWYDVATGDLLELHNPSIEEFPLGSGVYWCATTSANSGRSPDQNGYYGITLLRSTDLYNWVSQGHILDTPAGHTNAIRPSLLYCPSSGALTLWAHCYGGAAEQLNVWSCASGGDPSDPADWTDHGLSIPDGEANFKDFSRVIWLGVAYAIYVSGTGPVYISRLAADFLSTTGIPADRAQIGSGEAPIGFEWDDNGTPVPTLFYASVTNYYDSTSTYAMKCVTTTDPLDSDAYSDATDLFAVDPAGGNFNGQPASILKLPNKINGFVFVGDYWVFNPQYDSRPVWLPVNVDGAAPVVDVPAAWDFDDFEDAAPDAIPTVDTAAIDTDGQTLSLTFDSPVTPANATGNFVLDVAGPRARTIEVTLSIVATPDDTFAGTCASPVYAGETVTLRVAAGAFSNNVGPNEAATGIDVDNNSTAPRLVVSLDSGGGSREVPSGGTFRVRKGATSLTVTVANESGATLTLGTTALTGDGYALDGELANGYEITGSGSESFGIDVDPDVARRGVLTIPSDDPASPNIVNLALGSPALGSGPGLSTDITRGGMSTDIT